MSSTSLCVNYTSVIGCLTPNDEDGVCIDLKKCEKLRTLLENRRHIEWVKVHLRKSFCGYEGQSPKVCCPVEEQAASHPTTTTTEKSVSNAYHREPKPSSSLTSSGSSSSRLPSKNACGQVLDIRDRIFGGNPAAIGMENKYRFVR